MSKFFGWFGGKSKNAPAEDDWADAPPERESPKEQRRQRASRRAARKEEPMDVSSKQTAQDMDFTVAYPPGGKREIVGHQVDIPTGAPRSTSVSEGQGVPTHDPLKKLGDMDISETSSSINVNVVEGQQRLNQDPSMTAIQAPSTTALGQPVKIEPAAIKPAEKFKQDFFERRMEVPQSEPLAGRGQVRNDAGGYVWEVNDVTRVKRFICLGAETGQYLRHTDGIQLDAGQRDLTESNIQSLKNALAQGRGVEVVNVLKDFSVGGRTAKQDNIIFCLAFCARRGDAEVKKAAYSVMADICRIPTHLFMFVKECQRLTVNHTTKKGWGRAHRKAISRWYNNYATDPAKLALHVTKYKNRVGWSHKDVIRMCHVKPETDELNALYCYVTKGPEKLKEFIEKKKNEGLTINPNFEQVIDFLNACDRAIACKSDEDEIELVDLIMNYRLVREHIPTEMLKSASVWGALLEDMPMTAMIRNLGRMTNIGFLKPNSQESTRICQRLEDKERLHSAKIHPFNVLVAMLIYKQGKGQQGNLQWEPCKDICESLEKAFYLSFKNVPATGKRFCLAMDVSGSMTWGTLMGIKELNPRVAASCMLMVTAKTETNHEVVGFSHNLVPIDIRATDDLHTVTRKVGRIPMGATDCAAPVLWATENKKKFDVFIVYTDCETWVGPVHPSEALKTYRRQMGINARLIVCAMTSNGFTLADPADPGMLDMTGFDTEAPGIIRDFSTGVLD